LSVRSEEQSEEEETVLIALHGYVRMISDKRGFPGNYDIPACENG
jgi:hypothetical protein